MNAPGPHPVYEPTVQDLQTQLPAIGRGLYEALALLSLHPTMGRASQVAAQLSGASAIVGRLREALNREAAENAADAKP